VIECHDGGLAVRLRGPHRGPSLIPWDNIRDVGGDVIDDEGDDIPLLVVTVFNRDDLPENPWGARWVADRELGVMAQDFDDDPHRVAERIADYAVDAVKRKRRQTTANLWKEEA
jgi:hypothetical protein